MTEEQRRKQDKKAKQFAELLAGGASWQTASRTGSLDEIPLDPEALRQFMGLQPAADDCLEQSHLQDQPKPLSRSTPSEAFVELGRLPPMDLVK